MRLLCWNYRGFGSDATVGELCWLVRVHRPSLLFLSETKMRDSRVRSFMWSLGYSGCYAVSSSGLSGGLALFWLSSVPVTVMPCNARCIDVQISPENGIKWRATFVYGEPRKELRHEFWEFLRFMRAQWNGPWLCCGDFNKVLSQDGHLGIRDRTETQINAFRDCLQVTRVNSTNLLNEGLRIGEIGRRMNSKVKLVEIGVCRK
jgi:hypothetical protein